MKRSQSAIEFVLIVAFVVIAFVLVFSLIQSRFSQAQDEAVWEEAELIAHKYILSEVQRAVESEPGYTRAFTIPERHNGEPFTIEIVDDREVIVTYKDFEYVSFLPVNVSGPLNLGFNTVSRFSQQNFTFNPLMIFNVCMNIVYDPVGPQIETIELEDPPISPLRVYSASRVYGIALVPTTDVDASSIRIYYQGQYWALKRGTC